MLDVAAGVCNRRLKGTWAGAVILAVLFWLCLFCLSKGMNDPFMYFPKEHRRMKRIKPQYFLILLLVAAIAAAPFHPRPDRPQQCRQAAGRGRHGGAGGDRRADAHAGADAAAVHDRGCLVF